jgi:hypothetical protein
MWVGYCKRREKNSMCVLSPHTGITIEEEKSNVMVLSPSKYCKRGGKNSMCALNPN